MQIAVRHLNYIYAPATPFERQALYDICFEIPFGTYTAIIGKTGSGKSTLIQLLSGLLTPSSGEMEIGGVRVDATSKSLQGLRDQVGLVFQYPEHQLFAETVAKDVAFGPSNQGLSEEEVWQRVEESLTQVELPRELWHRSPFQLSGGQMRRVAVAGVLAMKPKVLILDEPTAALDPIGKKHLLQTIYRLHQMQGFSIIHVTHDMEEAAMYADQLLVLSEGRVVLFGTPENVFQQTELLLSLGLDVPEAVKWVNRLNQSITPSLPKTLFTAEQLAEELIRRRERKHHE